MSSAQEKSVDELVEAIMSGFGVKPRKEWQWADDRLRAAQTRESAIPLLLKEFRQTPTKEIAGKVFVVLECIDPSRFSSSLDRKEGDISTGASNELIDLLIEIFRQGRKSKFDECGELDTRLNSGDFASGPAFYLVCRVKNGCNLLKERLSVAEYEEAVVRAHNWGNGDRPLLTQALAEIGSELAARRLLKDLFDYLRSQAERDLSIAALGSIGNKCLPIIVDKLKRQRHSREIQRSYRCDLLKVLTKCGDRTCVEAITTVAAQDATIEKEAREALSSIARRDHTPAVKISSEYVIPGVSKTTNLESQPSRGGTKLRLIDLTYRKIFQSGVEVETQEAMNHKDGWRLLSILNRAYGDLEEIVCLSGPHEAKCLLVFKDGTGVPAGAKSGIPILTFGYDGSGPRIMTDFLTAGEFAVVNASEFKPPVIVRRDGSHETGVANNKTIRWSSGQETTIPKFPNEELHREEEAEGIVEGLPKAEALSILAESFNKRFIPDRWFNSRRACLTTLLSNTISAEEADFLRAVMHDRLTLDEVIAKLTPAEATLKKEKERQRQADLERQAELQRKEEEERIIGGLPKAEALAIFAQSCNKGRDKPNLHTLFITDSWFNPRRARLITLLSDTISTEEADLLRAALRKRLSLDEVIRRLAPAEFKLTEEGAHEREAELRQREEERTHQVELQSKETEERKRQAELKRKEEELSATIEVRRASGKCLMCGRKLNFFARILAREKHPQCTVFTN